MDDVIESMGEQPDSAQTVTGTGKNYGIGLGLDADVDVDSCGINEQCIS